MFPLTSAFSRREREKRSRFSGKAMAGFCSGVGGVYEMDQRVFLLPAGEGQDEAERGVNSDSHRLSKAYLKARPGNISGGRSCEAAAAGAVHTSALR
jgi:hypothetical protein